MITKTEIARIIKTYKLAKKRLLLLDYDGTLQDFAQTPAKAKPSDKLLNSLNSLIKDTKNSIVIISGRTIEDLDGVLGHLPINMSAEYGAFKKYEQNWQPVINIASDWKTQVRPLFETALNGVAGSRIEDKATGLVFHYKHVNDEAAAIKVAARLASQLVPFLEQSDLELREEPRERVVELKLAAAKKIIAAEEWLKGKSYDFVLCAGDTASDEEMFAVLPKSAITIRVGPARTTAKYQIDNPEEMVQLLLLLAKS